jgi:hypothetical protein
MISVVTVSMNRTTHLLESAKRLSAINSHNEHLIVDWSSKKEISRSELPEDPRIKLIRVSGESDWWLTRAYNFAVSMASNPVILKMDADVLLDKDFFNNNDLHKNQVLTAQDIYGGWSSPAGLSGLFSLHRSDFDSIGGFNEYIKGWGWDEMDLMTRLWRKNLAFRHFDLGSTSAIKHSNTERSISNKIKSESKLSCLLACSNKLNSLIATSGLVCEKTPKSRYSVDGSDEYYCADLPSRINIDAKTADRWLQEMRKVYLGKRVGLFGMGLGRLLPRLPVLNKDCENLLLNHPLLKVLR